MPRKCKKAPATRATRAPRRRAPQGRRIPARWLSAPPRQRRWPGPPRPAQAGASTNSADGAKSRGTAKATSSNSSSASKPAAGRAALSTMHVAYNANQPNANVQPVAMFEGAEDHETSSGGGNAETHNAPNKASRDNVLATYSSLARVSLAADVKLKRVA